MRMYDIIKRKRDGAALTTEEINFFVDGATNKEIPSYQISALLMAIYFNGMNERETLDLTFAIRDSGSKLDLGGVKGIRADKHSTGGVGDKTSLVVMPIVASLGIKVAKMSGRALGHTGGTVDKLESIDGFNVEMDAKSFAEAVDKVGFAIVGQSATLAPADKILYALRDLTATVDSLPLIVSSIMGKKLAADDDCIVLDVKTGSGAFMKTLDDSRKLARMCVDIGKKAGKKISALITDMDTPLGNAIGNSLEVIEAIRTLKGNGPKDLTELSLALSDEILYLCGKGTREECRIMSKNAIMSGRALDAFANMVQNQGGNRDMIYNVDLFPRAKFSRSVKAKESGYITSVDAEGYGTASLLLGAGRRYDGERIDHSAGIVLKAKTGDHVNAGDEIAVLYSDRDKFDEAEEKLRLSTIIGERAQKYPLIIERVE